MLVSWLREQIATLRPGDRLPSTRRLVELHSVSPVTVSRALTALANEGLVVARPGDGTFVAQPPRRLAPLDHSWQTLVLSDRSVDVAGLSPLSDPLHDDAVLSLATGYLHPSLMPQRALNAALVRASRHLDVWERPPTLGLHGLRTWFASGAGPGVDARDVLVTSGGQGAISATLRSVLAPGAPLLVESPTYPGALAAARAAGIRPVPVPTDADGIVPELLARAFELTSAQALYCQPQHQNPTGSSLTASRRRAVLEVAQGAGAFVIEDDFARLLSHRGRTAPSLLSEDLDGRVIHITSLTKVASPSLRVGAILARGPVADRLRSMRVVDDMFVPRPIQEATLELVSRGLWDQHLSIISDSLGRRCSVLAQALASRLPQLSFTRPSGGMHIWAALPEGLDDVAVTEAARRCGVVVMAGSPFFPAEAPGPFLRLTFSAAASEADLAEGVLRLAAALSRFE